MISLKVSTDFLVCSREASSKAFDEEPSGMMESFLYVEPMVQECVLLGISVSRKERIRRMKRRLRELERIIDGKAEVGRK